MSPANGGPACSPGYGMVAGMMSPIALGSVKRRGQVYITNEKELEKEKT